MYYRQGDVLFVPVTTIPKGKKRDPRNAASAVLVEGEVTGHAHRCAVIDAVEVLDCGEGLYLKVGDEGVSIVHEEHAPIMLPKGGYEVRRQVEYTPEGIRNVAD